MSLGAAPAYLSDMPSNESHPVEVSTSTARRSRSRFWIALGIAMIADAVQIIFVPLFGAGFASPFNDVLDLVMGAAMVWLIGWHLAFLPAFAVELMPLGDMAPTWTLAVLVAGKSKRARLREESHSIGRIP